MLGPAHPFGYAEAYGSMRGRGERGRFPIVVVQGAKALTASNPRRVGRGCPEGAGSLHSGHGGCREEQERST